MSRYWCDVASTGMLDTYLRVRVDIIGHLKSCMTEIYLYIDARMADYIRTHPYLEVFHILGFGRARRWNSFPAAPSALRHTIVLALEALIPCRP